MESPSLDRLDSWKEIAAYLGRTEKTARRWERHEGLPVHRLQHAARGSVYAFKSELDVWRASRDATPTPSSLTSTVEVPKPRAPTSSTFWRSDRIRMTVVAAAAMLVVTLAVRYRTPDASDARPTIAVLPFASTTDPTGADAGAAMASAVVDHLSGAADLRVRPFAASLRYERPGQEAAVTGRRMGVDVVATGQVRESNARVSISVALIDTATNTQLWGTTFDAEDRELGALPARVAESLRDRLLHRRGMTPRGTLTNQLSGNPEAVRTYLRAIGFPRNPGRQQIETSIALLNDTLRLDPSFSRAHASLALAHVALSFFAVLPAADTIGRAMPHAERALALDRSSGSGHQALAAVHQWYEFDRQAAERHYQAAIAASPGASGALNWYADFLVELGRFDEAQRVNEAAARADPGWLEVDVVRGNIRLFQGRAGEAEAIYRQALAVDPHHGLSRYFLAEALMAMGRPAEAVTELREAARIMGNPPFVRGTLVRALAQAGAVESRGELDAMIEDRTRGYFPAFAIAEGYAALGHEEQALDWLEHAADERLLGYYQPSVSPAWDALRESPRFLALLRRLDLPALPAIRHR